MDKVISLGPHIPPGPPPRPPRPPYNDINRLSAITWRHFNGFGWKFVENELQSVLERILEVLGVILGILGEF